jgi:hypothetical protein
VAVKTKAEILFEDFCDFNRLVCEKVEEGKKPTPDYKVVFNGYIVYIEVKQIDKDDNFSAAVSSRTVGSHIREKIKKAKKQVKVASSEGFPSILLLYNNLDGMQMFGTEQHDFMAAMYGDMTLVFNKKENKFTDSFYGRNRSFSEDKRTYFSAVGFLSKTSQRIRVLIYENAFAKNRLDFSKIPSCIEVIRIKLE